MIGAAEDGLLVVYLRRALVALYLELTTQTVNEYFQVQFAHSRDDRLACLFVGANVECWIFFRQLRQSVRQLVEVCLRLGLNRDPDYGIWERHALQHQWCALRTKRVTGADVLKANHCADVPCFEFFDGVLLVRVHLEDARNTLLLAAARVDHV